MAALQIVTALLTRSNSVAATDSHTTSTNSETASASPADALTVELIDRVGWFISLRWIAALAVLAGALIGKQRGYDVPVVLLVVLAAVIAGYNVLLRLGWKKLVKAASTSARSFRIFSYAQVILDYLALAVAIHLTGGIESPLTVFFIFHIIVTAMLLPGRSAYLDAVLASVLVGVVALYEGHYHDAHYAVIFKGCASFYNAPHAAVAWYLFLVFTFLISSFIAATIGTSLERKVQDLFRLKSSLEEANEMLKAADKEKTDFMKLVTHELRSPMVAIRSILQALIDQYAGKLNPQQLGLLHRTDHRAEQMIDMVGDLLRLAKTRSGSPKEKEAFDFGEVVESVVELFRPQAVQAGVGLEFTREPDPTIIHGDRGDMLYAATNLVSNAVKYTPPGGRITVRLSQTPQHVVLEVADTGIGIPAEDMPKLFTEFFRASNAKRQHATGTGLGLVLIKRLLNVHGGDISVTSEFGKGSTFTVTVPRDSTS